MSNSVDDGLVQPCADVLVITTQSTGDGALDDDGRLLANAAFVDAVVERLPVSLTTRHVALSDLSGDVAQLRQELSAGGSLDADTSPFLAPALLAAADVELLLLDSRERCGAGGEVVLLVGAGQGAISARWSLRNGSAGDNLLSLVTISDPYRDGEELSRGTTTTVGDAIGATGVLHAAALLSRAPESPALTAEVAEVHVDVCVVDDPYCDDTSSTLDLLGPPSESLSTVAENLAERASGLHAFTRAQLVVPGRTDVSTQVNLDVGSRSFLVDGIEEWRISPSLSPRLTPGLALAPTGQLSLFSTIAGEVRYVAEARPPGGLWVPFELVVETAQFDSAPVTRGSEPLYPPAPSSRSQLQQCADVLFVGARGSGQSVQEGAGYSPQFAIARDGFADSIPNSTRVREVYLEYPAVSVFPNVLLYGIDDRQPLQSAFDLSVALGVQELTRVLTDSARNCPGERWVLGGYSQGALVVHQAMVVHRSAAIDRMTAALLVADPARFERSDVVNLGTAGNSGIGVLSLANPLIPAELAARTVSLCTDEDLVCDPNLLNIAGGFTIHGEYRNDYQATWRAGERAANIHSALTGQNGANVLDNSTLVHGVDFSRGSRISDVELIVAASGREDLFWIESDWTTNRWGTTHRVMSTHRSGRNAAWATPSMVHDIGLRLRIGDIHSLTTSDGHAIVMWEEAVEGGWVQWGSSKWGYSTLWSVSRASGESEFGQPEAVFGSQYRDYSDFELVTGEGGHAALVVKSRPSGAPGVPEGLPAGEAVDVATLDPASREWSPLANVAPSRNGDVELAIGATGLMTLAWESNEDALQTVGGVWVRTIHTRSLLPGQTEWMERKLVPLPSVIRGQTQGLYDLPYNYGRLRPQNALAIGADGATYLLAYTSIRFGSELDFTFELDASGEWREVQEPRATSYRNPALKALPDGRMVLLSSESIPVYSSTNPLPAGEWTLSQERDADGEWSIARSISEQPMWTPVLRDGMNDLFTLSDGTILVLTIGQSEREVPGYYRFRWTALVPGAANWSAVQEVYSFPSARQTGVSTNTHSLSLLEVAGDAVNGATLLVSAGGPSTQQIRTINLPVATTPRTHRDVDVMATLVSLSGTDVGDTARIRVAARPEWLGETIGRLIPGTIEVMVDGAVVATTSSRVASGAPGGESAPLIDVPLSRRGNVSIVARFLPADTREYPVALSGPLEIAVGLEAVGVAAPVASTTPVAGMPFTLVADVATDSTPTAALEFWLSKTGAADQLLGESVVSNGVATFVVADGLPIGNYGVFAVYPGDELRSRAVSLSTPIVVAGQDAAMTWPAPAPFAQGDNVAASVTLNPRAAGGTVTISGHSSVASARTVGESGQLSIDLSRLPQGAHVLQAQFESNGIVDSAQVQLVLTVGPPREVPPVGFTVVTSPVVQGELIVGSTVTATVTGWQPAPTSLSYQWLRGGQPIVGAVGGTYALGSADVGQFISVRVVGARPGYVSTTRTSIAQGPVAAAEPSVDRLSGADRFATAAEVSKQYPAFEDGHGVVYIANGLDYPDALSAAPAAGHQGAPLLLSRKNELPGVIRDEIERLNPKLIVIAGGTGVISTAVENELRTLAPEVRRDAGLNRYETSRELTAEAFGDSGATTAFLATGRGFPDALSASAAAGTFSAPVILVDGSRSAIDADTAELLERLGVTKVYIAGGTGVISRALQNYVAELPFIEDVERLAGSDRYLTSQQINGTIFATSSVVYLAVGTGFADALAGAALASKANAPLFVVRGTCVPGGVLSQIATLGATEVVLLGGTGALSTRVAALARC